MALVTVQLNTEVPEEKAALAQLFGGGFVAAVQNTAAPVTVPSQVPAPAPKAKVTPKVTPKPEPVVEEPAEDLLGGVDYAAQRQASIDAATVLVTNGEQQKVKDALASLSVKRVGELADHQLEAFLAAVA